MAQSAALRHGGDLTAAQTGYPDAPGPWIDLSTGINPWPYPVGSLPADCWTRLPAAGEETALRAAAAAYFSVAESGLVLAAPGTQALIQLLPRLRGATSRVAVLSPTYGEHAISWRAAGHDVWALQCPPDAAGAQAALQTAVAATPDAADVVVTVNPNNPDGRVIGRDGLLDAADRLAARGGWLVVDEAFADPTPETSVADCAGRPGLVILRSFGKFFGLAGARLGFMLAPPPLLAAAAQMLGPWAVSGPALAIGRAAYQDANWIAATRRRLKEQATGLDQLLQAKGLRVAGGTPLFRLAETATPDGGGALFQRLARAGVWTRPFPFAPHQVRFGLPPDAAAIARLTAAL